MLRLHVGYPNLAQEREIIRDRAVNDPIDSLERVMSKDDLIAAQDYADSVRVDDALIDYLLQIVEKTRQNPVVELGVSPRGALSLVSSAKALATIAGRNFCIADDIKRLILPCFAHRMMVSSASSKINRRSQEANRILGEIIASVDVPV